MKKIMLLYASYGGGHLYAAKNLEKYIRTQYPDYDIVLFDCMRYINRVIDKVCGTTYSQITKNLPWFWGKIYYQTQEPMFKKILNLSTKLLSYKLRGLLRDFKPDIIISTHFFVSHMCSIAKQQRKINVKLATVVTDYGKDPYDEWIANHNFVDYIFVANSEIKQTLIKKGVSKEKVFDTGIPISDKFLKKYDRSKILNTFNLDPNKKIILFFGGGKNGLGNAKTLEIFEILLNNFINCQIVAISGENRTLKKNFLNIIKKCNARNVYLIGFTNRIAELMAVSTVVVTKPGGLTSTEALVSGLPIVAINPIPGQEKENIEFLEKKGVAIEAKSPQDVERILTDLLNNETKYSKMKENIALIAKPNSTRDICHILFKK